MIKDALPVSVDLISGGLAPEQWKDASSSHGFYSAGPSRCPASWLYLDGCRY
ncbi:hypothetical protein GYMLUDRAFT_39994 [Collybiopsis luxurians FD-317 M1]|nr:hypothetical protein GYMLUDRAFT_39994 [Collybiopsis luxurians FD-317 M1]